MGQYIKQECIENNRAVFKHIEKEIFLYYKPNGWWMVKSNIEIIDKVPCQNYVFEIRL